MSLDRLLDQVHCADNLAFLRAMPNYSVQLVYIDPPFFTGRVHTAKAGSFDDRWTSRDAYLDWMRERIVELHRVLAANGSIYLHCDPPIAAYLRLLLDEVFGPTNFRNAICWQRSHAHSSTTRRLGAIHDTILFYGRSQRITFHPPSGLSDLWQDVMLNAASSERTGWPTQKPLALLERIVVASSNPGGVVLDAFCGSGTACAAAAALGRHWIGVDSNPDAVAVATARLGIDQQVKLAV